MSIFGELKTKSLEEIYLDRVKKDKKIMSEVKTNPNKQKAFEELEKKATEKKASRNNPKPDVLKGGKITPAKLQAWLEILTNPPVTRKEIEDIEKSTVFDKMKFNDRERIIYELYVQGPLLAKKYGVALEDVWLGKVYDVSNAEAKAKAKAKLGKDILSAITFVISAFTGNAKGMYQSGKQFSSGTGELSDDTKRAIIESERPDLVLENLVSDSAVSSAGNNVVAEKSSTSDKKPNVLFGSVGGNKQLVYIIVVTVIGFILLLIMSKYARR